MRPADCIKDITRIAAVMIYTVCIAGCSLVTLRNDTYRRTLPEVPPQQRLSFEDTESIAQGATLNLMKSAEVYYEGCEPLSDLAGFIYEWAIRMVGFVGVNTDFDPSDPEAMTQALEKGSKAVEAKNRLISEQQKTIDKLRDDLANERGTSKVLANKNESLWKRILWGIVGFLSLILVIVLILFIIEKSTGIPILTGLRTVIRWVRQVTAGVQKHREHLKATAMKSKRAETILQEMPEPERTEIDRHIRSRVLEELDSELDKHQDKRVKKHIKHLKIKGV